MISGALDILGTVSYWIGLGKPGSGFGQGDIPPFVPSIIFGLPVPSLILAMIALIGGIVILLRKRWILSLVSTIAAILSFMPLGIPALILVALSKDEFK
jgi:hypothetical protein